MKEMVYQKNWTPDNRVIDMLDKGKWVKSLEEFELWITNYKILE